jgi:hypothetical protein
LDTDELVQQGLKIAANNRGLPGVSTQEVRCGVCNSIVHGWLVFAEHVLDSHPDDKHRAEWARNALSDLVQRNRQDEINAAQMRADGQAKQARVTRIRVKVEAKERARLAVIQQRRDHTAQSKAQTRGHSWLYWLFTPRPKTHSSVVNAPTRPTSSLTLTRDEALRRVTTMRAAKTTDPSATTQRKPTPRPDNNKEQAGRKI